METLSFIIGTVDRISIIMATVGLLIGLVIGVLIATRSYKNVRPREQLELELARIEKQLRIENSVKKKMDENKIPSRYPKNESENDIEYSKQCELVNSLVHQHRTIYWVLFKINSFNESYPLNV